MEARLRSRLRQPAFAAHAQGTPIEGEIIERYGIGLENKPALGFQLQAGDDGIDICFECMPVERTGAIECRNDVGDVAARYRERRCLGEYLGAKI